MSSLFDSFQEINSDVSSRSEPTVTSPQSKIMLDLTLFRMVGTEAG